MGNQREALFPVGGGTRHVSADDVITKVQWEERDGAKLLRVYFADKRGEECSVGLSEQDAATVLNGAEPETLVGTTLAFEGDFEDPAFAPFPGPFDPSTPEERRDLARYRMCWRSSDEAGERGTFYERVKRHFPDARDVENVGIADCTLFNATAQPRDAVPSFFTRLTKVHRYDSADAERVMCGLPRSISDTHGHGCTTNWRGTTCEDCLARQATA